MPVNYGGPTGKDLLALRSKGLTTEQVAKQVGLPVTTVMNRIWQAQHNIKTGLDVRDVFRSPIRGQPLALSGDIMITGDVHVPYTDYELATRVAMVGKKHLKRPRRLLIAGDLFSMESFSMYAAIIEHPSWAQEREAVKELLHLWLAVYDEIYMLMGNHERRLQKWTAGAFEETDLLALTYSGDKVHWSNFGYCTVDTERGKWRVTHPRNYSINRLTVAEALANKFQCNIISHHEHHLAMGYDRYGHYMLVNNGWLGDESKLPYVALDDSKSNRMMKGFCMLRDGIPTIFADESLHFTDWARWL